MNSAHADAPEINTLEISVFGPGKGECIVVHVPGGYWFAIDSFRVETRDGRRPVAGRYLAGLGADLHALFVTHWHIDHTAGAGELLHQFAHSLQLVGLPGGFGKPELMSFVSDLLPDGFRFRRVRDLVGVMTALDEAQLSGVHKVLLNDGTQLAPRNAAWSLEALSPSLDDIRAQLLTLSDLLSETPTKPPRRFDANEACAVLRLEVDGCVAIFCSDLDSGDTDGRGWQAIVRNHGAHLDAHVVKVGHHGSDTAHHPPAWQLLASTKPTHGVITPYPSRGGHLPRDHAVRRIRKLTTTLHLTSPRSGKKPKRAGKVKLEQTPFSDYVPTKPKHEQAIGQVRYRWLPGSVDPEIKVFPPASKVS